MTKGVKTKIKQILLKLTGQVSHLKAGVTCQHAWYGNQYGGFYVCPELVNENSVVYSFGIGEDISFDRAINERHNCHVYGFDPTPKSINWVKSQTLPERFHFYEYGISSESGQVDFYLPKNSEHVSGSVLVQNNVDEKDKVTVAVKSLSDTVKELNHERIDVLKMDIEGAEYDVIETILSTKIPITQILIEFHDRFVENGRLKTKEIIRKLSRSGYEIFAVSESFEEVSFIRKEALPA